MDNSTKMFVGLKAVSEAEVKRLRKEVAPGEYVVDTLVRIHGKLTVNGQEETTPTYSLLGKDSVALMLGFLGCTRENVANALIKAAKAKIDGKVADPEYLAAFEKGELALEKMVSTLPKVKRAGKVLGQLSMDEVTYVTVAGPAVAEKKTA